MREKATLFLILLTLGLSTCSDPEALDRAPEDAHSQGGLTHTRPHDEPSISVTLWTDDLELFMEHPHLSVGQASEFAVHLTRLADFQPLAQGPILFRFVKNGAPPRTVTVGNPDTPGIFAPTITFDEAGEYTLQLEVTTDEVETSLRYGPIAVLEKDERPVLAEAKDTCQSIAYLKEQQWKLPFGSAQARRQTLHETVRVPAQIIPRTGAQSVVSAAMGGRYEPPAGGIPALGTTLRKGDLLGYVELLPMDRASLLDSQVGAGITLSRLSEDVARAEAAVAAEQSRIQLAEKEAARVTALVEAEALPTRRLEQVLSELEVRRASLEAARQARAAYRKAVSRYDSVGQLLGSIQERVPVHAPISGQLVASNAIPGQYVDDREMLFRIVDLRTVWVQGQVFEKDLARVESLQGGTLELPGLDQISLESSSLVMIGSIIDPAARTFPVVFEVENRGKRLKLGTLGRLDLMTAEVVEALGVPRSAVLLEENRTVVYVQVGGETFERRLVKTGLRDRDWVQILEGLEAGERIVTVGAYDVALASRSSEVPERGHVH